MAAVKQIFYNVVEFCSGHPLDGPPKRAECRDLRHWAQSSLKWSLSELVGRMHPNREFLLIGNVFLAMASWLLFYTALRITAIQSMYDSNLQMDSATRVVAKLQAPLYLCSVGLNGMASLGFVGALREIEFALRLYGHCMACIALLLCILLASTALCVFALQNTTFEIAANFGVAFYTESDRFKRFVDHLQQTHRCCGVFDWRDWNANGIFQCNFDNPSEYRCRVPESCCKQVDMPLCYEDVLNRSSYEVSKALFHRPCLKEVHRLLETEQRRLLKIFALLLLFFALLSAMARACSRTIKLTKLWALMITERVVKYCGDK